MTEEALFFAWMAYAVAVKLVQLAMVPGYGRAYLDWMTLQGTPPLVRHPLATLAWLTAIALPPLLLFAIGWRP